MNKTTERPVNLDLFQMRMPVMAVVSILHRLSGMLLIAILPYGIYLFDLSLVSEQGFQQVQAQLSSIPVKMALVLLIWMFSHHLCAGIRFLLIDIDLGVIKQSAIKGAWYVHLGAIALTLLLSFMVMF